LHKANEDKDDKPLNEDKKKKKKPASRRQNNYGDEDDGFEGCSDDDNADQYSHGHESEQSVAKSSDLENEESDKNETSSRIIAPK
jgi:hypothetical protein